MQMKIMVTTITLQCPPWAGHPPEHPGCYPTGSKLVPPPPGPEVSKDTRHVRAARPAPGRMARRQCSQHPTRAARPPEPPRDLASRHSQVVQLPTETPRYAQPTLTSSLVGGLPPPQFSSSPLPPTTRGRL